MPKLKARILNLFEEVIDVLRAWLRWLHDHTLLVSYENMGSFFCCNGLKQNHVTHQKQHLYAKPCGAYDGYYMLSPCNYALPNPASQWQHWSKAVNVDTVLTTYHILIYTPYIGKLTRESMHTSAAVPTSAFRQTNSKQWRAWQQWQHQNTVSNKTFIRYHGDSLCLLLPESSWKTYSCFSNCMHRHRPHQPIL